MTKPEFLVAKEKMLVALATILPSVASKCVHVRKKHVVIGGKHDMFCHHLKALQQLRELTIFSGDTLEHVDCAFHYLEKQSVFDVDVDDVK